MPWTLEYNETLNIIEVVLTGNVTGSDLRESTSQTAALSKEHGVTSFLIDASEQTEAGSIVDIYDLPANQYEAESLSHKSRAAYVPPKSPALQDAARFYETVCNNRGWLVRTFANRDDAVAWLTKTGSP